MQPCGVTVTNESGHIVDIDVEGRELYKCVWLKPFDRVGTNVQHFERDETFECFGVKGLETISSKIETFAVD